VVEARGAALVVQLGVHDLVDVRLQHVGAPVVFQFKCMGKNRPSLKPEIKTSRGKRMIANAVISGGKKKETEGSTQKKDSLQRKRLADKRMRINDRQAQYTNSKCAFKGGKPAARIRAKSAPVTLVGLLACPSTGDLSGCSRTAPSFVLLGDLFDGLQYNFLFGPDVDNMRLQKWIRGRFESHLL